MPEAFAVGLWSSMKKDGPISYAGSGPVTDLKIKRAFVARCKAIIEGTQNRTVPPRVVCFYEDLQEELLGEKKPWLQLKAAFAAEDFSVTLAEKRKRQLSPGSETVGQSPRPQSAVHHATAPLQSPCTLVEDEGVVSKGSSDGTVYPDLDMDTYNSIVLDASEYQTVTGMSDAPAVDRIDHR